MQKIGYIGLGIMGGPCVHNLLGAGYPLRIWARRPEAMQPLLEAGAVACASPAEMASNVEILFVNVSDTADVEQIVLGDQGIIQGAAPDTVVVDMSTISPLATRRISARLAERGVHMLDAPVSGGEQGAIDGTLSIMVGGEAAVFEGVRPVLQVLGRHITHVGGAGAGQVAKACNQVVISQTIAAVGEAFLLADKAGVDPARVREALLGGFANSRVLEAHGQRMLDANYEPGFKTRLHHKDMRIVLDTAAQLGVPLPGAALAAQYLNILMGAGEGELDSSAIFRAQQRAAGGW